MEEHSTPTTVEHSTPKLPRGSNARLVAYGLDDHRVAIELDGERVAEISVTVGAAFSFVLDDLQARLVVEFCRSAAGWEQRLQFPPTRHRDDLAPVVEFRMSDTLNSMAMVCRIGRAWRALVSSGGRSVGNVSHLGWVADREGRAA